MSIRTRYTKLAEHVVSTAQIAEAAGVVPSAATNWTVRWDDFPAPLARYGTATLYPRDEVEDCLRRHGRTVTWKDTA